MDFKNSLQRIREIAQALPDDDPDKAEMLNTEGDYSKWMVWALTKRNEAIATQDAAKELANKYTARSKSFGNKADSLKDLIGYIMSQAGETKFTCEVGTVSERNIPPKPIVIDESKIPDDYFDIKKVLRKSDVNQAIKDGYEIDGVAMDNGGTSLTIRT